MSTLAKVDELTPFTPEEEDMIQQAYLTLREDYLNSKHRKKVEIIDRAFEVARKAHDRVRRKSGEPYILHPIAVAMIVSKEMGLGSTSICCALLHDVVEDTEYTVEDIRNLFTDNIARIVDGVTKVEKASETKLESLQMENYRKLLLTTADDPRVILIKLADRLHNMRTLGSMRADKKSKITGETLFIYAPLADRLGLFDIKTELEELCFFHEQPDKYQMIKDKVEAIKQNEEDLLNSFLAPIEAALLSKGIDFQHTARVKSYYSIWCKMQEKNVPFEDIYDIFAMRIIYSCADGYPEQNRAWDIYTIISSIYRAHPERLRDWMSSPKVNGYQALHATYMSPTGRWIEVQIRSERMNAIAERGVAAHWRYKSEMPEDDTRLSDWLDSIRSTLMQATPTAMDFLDNLKLSIYTNTINVFSPKGKRFTLPSGVTVLDFAYEIHSDLGDKCIGAKVNHLVVPISTKLQDNDQVEILSSEKASPQPIWLNYVHTLHAKNKIKDALRRNKREQVGRGEAMVLEFFAALGCSLEASTMHRLAHCILDVVKDGDKSGTSGQKLLESFFELVGIGHIVLTETLAWQMKQQEDPLSVASLSMFFSLLGVQYLLKDHIPVRDKTEAKKISNKAAYVLEESEEAQNYRIAKCCHPILGDDVVGVIEGEQVEVHDKHCARAIRLKSSCGDRLVSTVWGEHPTARFNVPIILRGRDSTGLLHAITKVLVECNRTNINSINICTKDGLFQGEMTLLVRSLEEFERIRERLSQQEDILEVIRKTTDLIVS